MDSTYTNKVLKLAVYAGEIMMRNGAEIYRVEDTIVRICTVCGIKHTEVFATPTGVFISIASDNTEISAKTYIKRIRAVTTDLSKISRINRFSREFVSTDMSVDEAMEVLKSIDEKRPYPEPVRLLGAALVSSAFCLIFDGGIFDAVIALIAGSASYVLSLLLDRYGINYFIHGLLCCAVASAIALAATEVVPGTSYMPIIIGTLMIYVPGVAITNSIRDFLTGDMLSGLARMTEAVLTAASLATGSGIAITLWHLMGGGM